MGPTMTWEQMWVYETAEYAGAPRPFGLRAYAYSVRLDWRVCDAIALIGRRRR